MKTIWAIVGILVILIILYVIYNKGKQTTNLVASKPAIVPPVATPVTPVPEVVTTVREPIPVYVPIVINNLADCNSPVYQNNLAMLLSDFRDKQTAYNNEINSGGPNGIALHSAMNIAYNAYLNERQKCQIII